MIADFSELRAVIFDYGNTLIPFGREEIAVLDRALATALGELYGSSDEQRVSEIRHQNRLAPYQGNPPHYRENDLTEITITLVRELYSKEPTRDELDILLKVRYESFLSVIKVEHHVPDVLRSLKNHYKLGLLSNYPSGEAIRESLSRNGLVKFFDSIVVSGDIGLVKPHDEPFAKILGELDVESGESVYVGDNWLADIQGAKRKGMHAVHLTEYEETPEGFTRQEGDYDATAEISHLGELLELLKIGR